MNTSWKNSLQEYCQKHKIPLPNYRIKNQSGPPHRLKFQVEVEADGHCDIGDNLCPTKKEAEQLAAKRAMEYLLVRNECSVSHLPTSIAINTDEHSEPPPPPYSQVILADSMNDFPNQYTDIENFIATKVEEFNGRIRKISPLNSQGQFKIDIAGSYRYCENIKRHHKKNPIYFIVDPMKRIYFQQCYDPDCYGFRSSLKYISVNQIIPSDSEETNFIRECLHCRESLTYEHYSTCTRCGEIFCSDSLDDCELCCDGLHCKRCFELCWDCHDS
ncbi:unnamed protein product [Rotaria sordida]|uniref:DNA-directed primase/polymerase protein n=1 Tax=Rotaria sordida TaxID=392033 RepID=A0A815HEX8_9BILA|nr:unnamed protein product [Rotaria sordida]